MVSTITTAVVTAGTISHATTSYEANAYATDFVTQGVVGAITNPGGSSASTGAFAVTQDASPDLGITVLLGNAYVTGTPSGQASQTLRCYMTTNYTTYTINANASGSTKYDWIYLSFSASAANNPDAGADNVITLFTSRSTSNTSDTGAPPTYGLLLAVVTVANGASSITNSNISDKRVQTGLSVTSSANTGGYTSLSQGFGTVTYNGNRNYTCTFTGINETGILSPGMRLLIPRTVPAPTQSTLLNGTTQFYSKTSPTGMTFTDDFVVSAFIKLTSYNGAVQTITSRFNNTSGWSFEVNASGQLRLVGYNASGGNFSQVLSYQSLPINKWVHVAAQLDMSSFTVTPTTSYMMIDGVDVPATVSRAGTNPTALIQAGNLEVGSQNGGTLPFNGKLAQVAIYEAKVTEATVTASIPQTLVGTETSLVSAYSFNNSINDLNANANNLTANGSAVATATDSPYAQAATAGTLEYGIITSVSFSTNTTVNVQVPEGSAIPTSGGTGAVSYSTQKAPYLMPMDTNKWRLNSLHRTTDATSSNATYQPFLSGGWALVAPVGAWKVGWQSDSYNTTTTTIFWALSPVSLTGSSSTVTAANTTALVARTVSPSAAATAWKLFIQDSYSITTTQTFVMYSIGSTTGAGMDGTSIVNEIFAEFAYL